MVIVDVFSKLQLIKHSRGRDKGQPFLKEFLPGQRRSIERTEDHYIRVMHRWVGQVAYGFYQFNWSLQCLKIWAAVELVQWILSFSLTAKSKGLISLRTLYLEVISLLKLSSRCCCSYSKRVEKLITGILTVALGKVCLATDVNRLSCFSIVLGKSLSRQLLRPINNTTSLTFGWGWSFFGIS